MSICLFPCTDCPLQILPLALYRHPHHRNDASMSFVYTNPTKDTFLGEDDHVLVYGNATVLKKVLEALSLPLARQTGTAGKFSLNPECLKVPPSSSSAPDPHGALKAAALKFGGGIKAQKVFP